MSNEQLYGLKTFPALLKRAFIFLTRDCIHDNVFLFLLYEGLNVIVRIRIPELILVQS